MENNKNGYLKLAATIIEVSVDDYRKALRVLIYENAVDKDWCLKKEYTFCRRRVQNAWSLKCECERFFLSDWFIALCSGSYSGMEVMKKIREDVWNEG